MSGDEGERSPAGNPIIRHVRTRGFEPAESDPEAIELLETTMARHLGAPATVFHELVSDRVHVDIHLVEPRPDRDFYTLFTTGMSDRRMNIPRDVETPAYLELMIALPRTWRLDQESLADERNYWPIRLLKMLARLPHEYDTWLGPYHTVPHGAPPEPEPYAHGTQLAGAMLTFPALVPEGFEPIEVRPGKTIWPFAVTPLYREEMDFKLARGAQALEALLEAAGVTELVDPSRKNVRRRKKFLGLF